MGIRKSFVALATHLPWRARLRFTADLAGVILLLTGPFVASAVGQCCTSAYTVGSYPYTVAVDNFNADAWPDLAVTNFYSNNVAILLGNPDGTFQTAVDFGAGTQPISVTVSDFDADGKRDLAVVNYNNTGAGTVTILRSNGDGTFQTAGTFATAGYAP